MCGGMLLRSLHSAHLVVESKWIGEQRDSECRHGETHAQGQILAFLVQILEQAAANRI